MPASQNPVKKQCTKLSAFADATEGPAARCQANRTACDVGFGESRGRRIGPTGPCSSGNIGDSTLARFSEFFDFRLLQQYPPENRRRRNAQGRRLGWAFRIEFQTFAYEPGPPVRRQTWLEI